MLDVRTTLAPSDYFTCIASVTLLPELSAVNRVIIARQNSDILRRGVHTALCSGR